VLDARGRVVHAGAGGAAVAGRGRDDLLGRSFGDLIDAADREAAQRVLGSPGDEETPPARAVLRLSPPPGGQPRRAVVACWRTSVDGMDGPLVCVLRRTADGERPDGRLDRLYICELTHGARVLGHFSAWGAEQQLGAVPDGLAVSDAWEACVAFSDRGVYGEAWARNAAGQPVTCTYRITGYDGETRWILDRSWPVVIPGGRQLLYGIVTDVTDHVTPRLTAADDAQIALTVRALGDLVFATDALPGRRAETSYASRPPEAYYGLQVEPGESSAETLLAAIVPSDRGAYERVQQAATAGRAAEAVVGVRGRDGAVRQFWFRSVPVAAPDGGARAVGVVSDVTGILGDRSPAPLAPAGAPARESSGEPPPALTPRQREILRLLAEGCSNEEIAQALSLSRTTVRNHTSGLYARLGVRSRLEAVAVARRLGIVS
jgi:DNA-binding CsgD family transcriptional regulator/PAS domain-containing protein